MYDVIGSLPSKAGAVNDTDTDPSLYVRFDPLSVADPIVGERGADLLDDSTIPGFFGLMSVIISYILHYLLKHSYFTGQRCISR